MPQSNELKFSEIRCYQTNTSFDATSKLMDNLLLVTENHTLAEKPSLYTPTSRRPTLPRTDTLHRMLCPDQHLCNLDLKQIPKQNM